MAHAPASSKALYLVLPPGGLLEHECPHSLWCGNKDKHYVTLRSATMPYGILDFGSWLEPRYIFAAGQLI